MSKLVFGVAVIAVLVLASCVLAEVLVYDPAAVGEQPDTAGYYNVGQTLAEPGHNALVGNSTNPWGGEGRWHSAVQHGASWAVRGEGLSYAKGGYELAVTGGSFVSQFTGNTNSAWRRFSPVGGDITEGTVYFSFLAKWNAFNGGWQAFGFGSGLVPTGSNDTAQLFVKAGQGTVEPRFVSGSDNSPPFGLLAGKTYFFVGRVEINQSFIVWINPALGIPENELTEADYEARLESIAPPFHTGGYLRGATFAPRNSAEEHEVTLDEWRIGTTWASVTPAMPAAPPLVLGDFNGDGTLSGLDIPGFKQALADPDGWAAANPGRPHPNILGDFNGDGAFSGLDIPGFKQALAGGSPDPPPPPLLKTVGPIAEGPLQVGTWAPLAVDTPPWVFPMVYHMDTTPPMPVQAYATMFVNTIKSFPEDRPIWIQSHRWFGNYKPGWDQSNIFAHAGDATPDGTPGIWPNEAKAFWLARQREFLAILKENNCRLDMWPLDHETYVNQWAPNFGLDDAFVNMVYDPRWATEAMPGMQGLRGIDLLHPNSLSGQPRWTRSIADGSTATDIRLAVDAAKVIAYIMPMLVLNEIFVEPIIEAYPHAIVSDYGRRRHRRPIPPLDPWGYMPGNQPQFWNALRALRPELTDAPGVGNAGAPSLYGGSTFAGRNPQDTSRVGGMLYTVDLLIERYGGDPEQITPWITLPNYVPDGGTRLPPDEYERFLVGLAQRGVRKFILWFDPSSQNTPEACDEFLAAVQKAYDAAEARLRGVLLHDPFAGTNPQQPGTYLLGAGLDSAANRSVGSAGEWTGEGHWAGNYSRGENWAPQEAGLTYTAGDMALATSGGSLVGQHATALDTSRPFLPSTEPLTSGTVYFSLLLKWDDWGGTWSYYGFGTGTAEEANSAKLYVRANEGTVTTRFVPGSANPNFYPLETGKTYLFVGRVDINETFTVWVNPALGIPEDDLTEKDYETKLVSTAPDGYSAGAIKDFIMSPRTTTATHAGHGVTMDEVRIGTTWTSVVPVQNQTQ